ncbi:hypothetical protein [Gemmatimonas sp.]|uniref:hypothetical protein n=1 Tax=Gemmatimonas sp. TaxID=1962908 RepID=UPI003568FDB3
MNTTATTNTYSAFAIDTGAGTAYPVGIYRTEAHALAAAKVAGGDPTNRRYWIDDNATIDAYGIESANMLANGAIYRTGELQQFALGDL